MPASRDLRCSAAPPSPGDTPLPNCQDRDNPLPPFRSCLKQAAFQMSSRAVNGLSALPRPAECCGLEPPIPAREAKPEPGPRSHLPSSEDHRAFQAFLKGAVSCPGARTSVQRKEPANQWTSRPRNWRPGSWRKESRGKQGRLAAEGPSWRVKGF